VRLAISLIGKVPLREENAGGNFLRDRALAVAERSHVQLWGRRVDVHVTPEVTSEGRSLGDVSNSRISKG